ncbi:hypothetical protein H8S90_04380 [Olivibacter sp. SDN3]|uniref:hypothetical protein n=1 Tax=Olivibacter sp. SDN3 TaxID=2764720 RepID=UPI0016516B04|nr:hypothetical protein [Olivibacter sp. SDN3]QNL50834.1 hypothetical protein H8S90_04380 [Olivibacter sp. SDN3]
MAYNYRSFIILFFYVSFFQLHQAFANPGWNNQPESVYLHISKSTYLPGETIWFNIYELGNGETSIGPKITYVEVLDAHSFVIAQTKVLLDDGTGEGEFQLPVAISSGTYIVVAYTERMKSYGQESFFRKDLLIVNPSDEIMPTAEKLPKNLSVRLENYKLVADLDNRIVVQLVDEYGRGLDYQGEIIDADKQVIETFSSSAFGLGQVSFIPKLHHQYHIIVKDEQGHIFEKEMPKVESEGFLLRLYHTTSSIVLKGQYSNATTENQFSLAIYHKGEKVLEREYDTDVYASLNDSLDYAVLPEGISYVVVRNAMNDILAEHALFKTPDRNGFTVNELQDSYNRRSFIKPVFDMADTDEKTTRFSISVYRVDDLQQQDVRDIATYYYLESDLEGKIEQPLDYFNAIKGTEDFINLDNLLIFYRKDQRFNEEIMTDVIGQPATFKFTSLNDNQPIILKNAYIGLVGSSPNYYVSKTDSCGMATFDLRYIRGLQTLAIGIHGENSQIEEVSPFYKHKAYKVYPFKERALISKETLLQYYINNQLNLRFNFPDAGEVQTQMIDTRIIPFYYTPDVSYDLNKYKRFATLQETFHEYIREVMVRRSQNNFSLRILDEKANTFMGNNPLILLDGVPMTAEYFLNYDPAKIETIELITDTYIYGPNIYDGILSAKTSFLSGDYPIDAEVTLYKYNGLLNQNTFQAPSYLNEDELKSKKPDFRNQLFWSVIEGEQTKSFFSSDWSGEYIIDIQGISASGRVMSSRAVFKVKD